MAAVTSHVNTTLWAKFQIPVDPWPWSSDATRRVLETSLGVCMGSRSTYIYVENRVKVMLVHCGWEMNLRNDPHTCWTISTISRTVYMLFTHTFFRNQLFKIQRHFELTLSCMWYIQFFIAEGSYSILQNLANFLFSYRATTNSSTGQTWAELFLSPNRGKI